MTAQGSTPDMLLEVRGLTKHFTLFFDLQNIRDEPLSVNEIAGPNTPDYARTVSTLEVGSLWAFGIKARF